MRCHNKIQLLSVLNNHLVAYPTPMNLNWSWNGGSLAGIMLASQMVTGILLAMHYVSHVDYAFASVQHLMTDVPSGMILRYAHANGASLFFIVVYFHILRGMYYNSGAQPRELVWITGVVILLVMIITAFIGYVLPWGQMSFWGATVITSLATAIPVVGKSIMYWLWGGFSVDNPTLNRFYSFHYTLPFILAGLSVFHIAALHQYGSTNPLGINSQSSSIAFGVYFGVKDMLGALFLAMLFSYLVFFNPDLLGHPDNLIPANPYSTPQHIVPEWYFLWVYAILRSIPNKAMGVLTIGLVFASLIAQPFIGMGGGKFRVATEWLYFMVVADLALLTWLGALEITPVTMFVGQCCTLFLFSYLLILVPAIGMLESFFLAPSSYSVRIGIAILGGLVLVLVIGVAVVFSFFDLFTLIGSGSVLMLAMVLPTPELTVLNKRNDQREETIFVAILSAKGWVPLQMTSINVASKFMGQMALHGIEVKLFTGSQYMDTMNSLSLTAAADIARAKSAPVDLTGVVVNLPQMSSRLDFNKKVLMVVSKAPLLSVAPKTPAAGTPEAKAK